MHSNIYKNNKNLTFLNSLYRIYLLNEFAADPNCKDTKGRTPLHFCCCRGNAHIAKVLLDRGAQPNQWDSKKEITALHCAAR